MNRLITAVLLGLWLVAGPGWAEQGSVTDELLRRLQSIDSVQGSFQQRQYDAAGALLAESSGRFRLLRPGYFAWDITAPDSQLIIADPQFLWHFDRDLETVTRRPVSGSGQSSPLQVLGGDEAVLREQYRIAREGSDAFVLTPTGADPGFNRLRVELGESGITAMQILDRLNQRVEISLGDVDSETVLGPEDFAFEPPPGADLFYYEQ